MIELFLVVADNLLGVMDMIMDLEIIIETKIFIILIDTIEQMILEITMDQEILMGNIMECSTIMDEAETICVVEHTETHKNFTLPEETASSLRSKFADTMETCSILTMLKTTKTLITTSSL